MEHRKIFIAYAEDDRHFVALAAKLLEAHKHEPWYARSKLRGGEVFARKIDEELAASDALVVIRPRLSGKDIAEALGRGMFHEGKPYDFDFDFTRSDRLVCTEVVYRSYEGISGMHFELTPRAGRMTLAAEDLLQIALDGNLFATVAVFSPPHGSRLITGSDADPILKATMRTEKFS